MFFLFLKRRKKKIINSQILKRIREKDFMRRFNASILLHCFSSYAGGCSVTAPAQMLGLTFVYHCPCPPARDFGCRVSGLVFLPACFKRLCATLICLTKNLVYKNIEAQMRKKIRTIVRTSSALNLRESKKHLNLIVAAKNNPFNNRWINLPHFTPTE